MKCTALCLIMIITCSIAHGAPPPALPDFSAQEMLKYFEQRLTTDKSAKKKYVLARAYVEIFNKDRVYGRDREKAFENFGEDNLRFALEGSRYVAELVDRKHLGLLSSLRDAELSPGFLHAWCLYQLGQNEQARIEAQALFDKAYPDVFKATNVGGFSGVPTAKIEMYARLLKKISKPEQFKYVDVKLQEALKFERSLPYDSRVG